MSTWITSMAHFPRPNDLSNRMPMALIKTTLHFGTIVKMAATNGLPVIHSCGGKIESKLEDQSDKILWKCCGCGDNGEISHWRGSGWENLTDENTPRLVATTKKKRREPKKTRQGILVLSKKELFALRKVMEGTDLAENLSDARPLAGNGFAITLTIKQLDYLYNIVGDLLDFGPSRQRKMWDDALNSIAWAMDEITMAEVATNRK